MVQGLPVKAGRVESAAVHRLAALYGLKCSAQGGGKKQTIMVVTDAFLEHVTGSMLFRAGHASVCRWARVHDRMRALQHGQADGAGVMHCRLPRPTGRGWRIRARWRRLYATRQPCPPAAPASPSWRPARSPLAPPCSRPAAAAPAAPAAEVLQRTHCLPLCTGQQTTWLEIL